MIMADNEQNTINNTEHKCSGRTNGYGGFTCMKCGHTYNDPNIVSIKTDKLPEKEAIELAAAMIDAAQARGYDGKGMGSALEAIEKRYVLVRRSNE